MLLERKVNFFPMKNSKKKKDRERDSANLQKKERDDLGEGSSKESSSKLEGSVITREENTHSEDD